MFTSITLHGAKASVLWGYYDAVVLRKWTIKKEQTKQQGEQWILRGVIERMDPFKARQKPLLFTAPRPKLPPWAWGIERLRIVSQTQIEAVLGPPEQ